MGLNPHCQGSNCLHVHGEVKAIEIGGKTRILCANCASIERRNHERATRHSPRIPRPVIVNAEPAIVA